MASASLRERSPSDSSLEKLDSRATPPASPRNPLRIRSTSVIVLDHLLVFIHLITDRFTYRNVMVMLMIY